MMARLIASLMLVYTVGVSARPSSSLYVVRDGSGSGRLELERTGHSWERGDADGTIEVQAAPGSKVLCVISCSLF